MHHLTMASGHGRWSRKSEVHQRAIAWIQPVLRAGLGVLPGSDWYLRSLPAGTPGGAAFELHHGAPRELGGRWMSSCYLAWTDKAAQKMWAAARANRSLVSPGLKRPAATPWLATATMPEALFPLDHELMFQLGDLERCVGWTILDAVAQETP